jgi:hypothetical protein
MFSALRDTKYRSASGLKHLASSGKNLARDKKRNEVLLIFVRLSASTCQVIFVTTVGVSCRIGVVLEKVNSSTDTFVFEALLGTDE